MNSIVLVTTVLVLISNSGTVTIKDTPTPKACERLQAQIDEIPEVKSTRCVTVKKY